MRSGRQNLGIGGDDFYRFDQWLGLGLIVANFLSFVKNIRSNTLGEVFRTFLVEVAFDMLQESSLNSIFISLLVHMNNNKSVLDGIQMNFLIRVIPNLIN